MLIDLIERAKAHDKEAMLSLVERFTPLLNKYASRLRYQDAFCDMQAEALEFFLFFPSGSLRSTQDGVVVNYTQRALEHIYFRLYKKSRTTFENEIEFSALSDSQCYYVSNTSAPERECELGSLFPNDLLTEKEIYVLSHFFAKRQSTAEIAETCQTSRQNVNQIKNRALSKLKSYTAITS